MPSTYSPLKIELPATGEQSGTWGNTTNTNLGTALEEAITGSANVTFASGNVVLTLTDTNASQVARNLRLNLIGVTGGSTRTLTVPAIKKLYLVSNNCADSVIVGNSTGATVTVPAGNNIFIYNDGTDVLNAITYITALNAASVSAGSVTTTQVDIVSQGDLRLQDTTGGQYVALQAPGTIATSYTLTLPVDDGTNGQALITDGNGVLSWSTAASGDVYGPASATDNAIARFDLTTGKIIQNSVVTIADTTGDMAGVGTLSSGAITTTGVLTVPAGTVSLPSITTTGDTNTGIFFPAADTIAFTEGGVEAMRIDSSANVGIGTTTPTTGTLNRQLTINSGAANLAGIVLQNNATGTASNNGTTINILNGTDFQIFNQQSGFISFGTNNLERMRITSTGSVGIGGTPQVGKQFQVFSPSATSANVAISATTGTQSAQINLTNNFVLTIGTETSSGGTLATGASAYASVINSVSQPLQFATNNNVRAVLDTGGNIGIRNVNPFTSPWNGFIVYQADCGALGGTGGDNTVMSSNLYWDGAASRWKYITSSTGIYVQIAGGVLSCYNAPSGTAGANATITQTLDLSTSGNMTLGNSTVTSFITYPWTSTYNSLNINSYAALYGANGGFIGIATNCYRGASGWVYKTSNPVLLQEMGVGQGSTTWYNANSGTAGAAVSLNQSAIFTGSANFGIGGVTPGNAQQRIASSYGATPMLQNEFILTLGVPNLGTHAGYILLARAYAGTLGQAASWVNGTITIKRGGPGSGNRTDVYTISDNTAYASEDFLVQVTYGASPFFVRTVKVTYGGVVYHAIETSVSGGNPDQGIWFTGSYANCSPLYVDATYVSSITAYGSSTVTQNTGTSGQMMTLTDSNLLLGTTTQPGGVSAKQVIQWSTAQVNAGLSMRVDVTTGTSHIFFQNPNNTVGSVSTSGSTTTYNTSSDYRLKENIAPMTGALVKISALKPVTYSWKVDGSDGEGFIAHELQEVAPYAVSGEKDGEQMQGVDYGKITPLLTAALQEALAKIESLEARLAVLESK